MKKPYTVVLAALQLLVGVTGSVYLAKVVLGAPITMSLFVAIPLTAMGLLLGVKNIIRLRK